MNVKFPVSREGWAPWYLIVWRLIWFVPVMLARVLFVLILGIGWGPETASAAWRDTE
jgi:hypothetical protein